MKRITINDYNQIIGQTTPHEVDPGSHVTFQIDKKSYRIKIQDGGLHITEVTGEALVVAPNSANSITLV